MQDFIGEACSLFARYMAPFHGKLEIRDWRRQRGGNRAGATGQVWSSVQVTRRALTRPKLLVLVCDVLGESSEGEGEEEEEVELDFTFETGL